MGEAAAPPNGDQVKAGPYSFNGGNNCTGTSAGAGWTIPPNLHGKKWWRRQAKTMTCVPKLSAQATDQQSHPHPTGTSACKSYVNNLTVRFVGFFLTVVS